MRWMLEHGGPEAVSILPQLELASVTPWRCSCGCASVEFAIDGHAAPTGGMHSLGEFVFGNGDELSSIFVFEQSGVLAGVEVVGYKCDAPRTLPEFEDLRPPHTPAAK